jgi:hypothetical protein
MFLGADKRIIFSGESISASAIKPSPFSDVRFSTSLEKDGEVFEFLYLIQ